MDTTHDWVWDIETYKSAFTFSIVRADGKFPRCFEVSKRMNEISKVFDCLDYLHNNNHRMVGFNSVGFDYPIVHELLQKRNTLPTSGKSIAALVHKIAQKQIESFKDGFGHSIKSADEIAGVLQEAISSEVPVLIHIPIDYSHNMRLMQDVIQSFVN